MPPKKIDGREIRGQLQKACAIAHGRGYGMSANELLQIILEVGLPSREDRKRMLAGKLAAPPPLPEVTTKRTTIEC